MSHLLGVRQRKSVHVEKYNIGCCGCEGLDGEYDAIVGVGATILFEGRGEEVIGGAVGPGDGGGEATVDEEGLAGPPTGCVQIYLRSFLCSRSIYQGSFFIFHPSSCPFLETKF